MDQALSVVMEFGQRPMHVLIIEDDMLMALNLQLLVEELGADSTAIADTEVAAVREALGHRPDLITSDVQLRQGTGPHAVQAIRASLGDIPVIYVTGRPDLVVDCDPVAAVLQKPFRWLDLIKAASALGLPSSGDPTQIPPSA